MNAEAIGYILKLRALRQLDVSACVGLRWDDLLLLVHWEAAHVQALQLVRALGLRTASGSSPAAMAAHIATALSQVCGVAPSS